MISPSLVFVLVEDKRQRQFLYRFLVRSGVHPGKIAFEQAFAGRGSGKQWVCDRFAFLVNASRRRNSKASTCLLAMMDADQLTLAKCIGNLDAALVAANQPKLDPSRDPIARLIPKWSIETWILYLTSTALSDPVVSEDYSYKHAKTAEQWNELVPQASELFCELTQDRTGRLENLIDSIRRGLEEIPRALPVGR